jgi:hypothetical protein
METCLSIRFLAMGLHVTTRFRSAHFAMFNCYNGFIIYFSSINITRTKTEKGKFVLIHLHEFKLGKSMA